MPPPPPRHHKEEARTPALPAPAGGVPTTPPASPPPAHEGFYLRLSPGIAYGATRMQTDRVSQPDYKLSGTGLSLDLWAGFGVSSGLVLGPAFSYWGGNDSEPELSGGAGSGESSSALLGAFVDAYPNPRRGEHFGGALALGTVSTKVSGRPEIKDYQGGGVGFLVFGGYDFWIARTWSLGGLLRLSGLATRNTTDIDGQRVERQATSYAASLAISLLYQ